MADKSAIEWTDATWNPVTGCTVVSPGCSNCYAMRLAGGRLREHPSRRGLTKPGPGGPVWTGEVRLNEEWLDQPLRWSRPRVIFVCAHGDLFHGAVPVGWIDKVFAVMETADRHAYQVLTKRPRTMRDWIARSYAPGVGPRRHIWLGTSVEDRTRKYRIDVLRETPAAVRFLSLEPLIEDLGELDLTGIHWVIVGGESGPGARPMDRRWAGDIRDRCVAAGVPFFFKQWGEYAPVSAALNEPSGWDGMNMRRIGKKRAGRLLDGRTWDEMPRAAEPAR